MATSVAPERMTGFGGVNPIIRVKDVGVSKDYYTRALGFKVDFETPGFISVSRGKCCLFLLPGRSGTFRIVGVDQRAGCGASGGGAASRGSADPA